ncbi:hypothetical protein C8D88_104123 [Lentzea atacamensis]|uniref:Uncharacterized protein n=1 Tax=Lentzea atacamensis TaxID=531938 RepID=A0A316I992_9PSEU|nr:hypothetical protein C8D88_104123 [Lentzea atacamensis]
MPAGRVSERIGGAITALGIAAGMLSVRHTAGHVADKAYKGLEVPQGAGHVRYHMVREAVITTTALSTVVIGVAAGPGRDRAMWRAMATIGVGYSAAMWSARPISGTWAPNRKALVVHAVSTAGLCIGVWLLRPARR